MRMKYTDLEAALNRKLSVTMPSGRLERMTTRKAQIAAQLLKAANGNWSSLQLIMQIAQASDIYTGGIVVRPHPGNPK